VSRKASYARSLLGGIGRTQLLELTDLAPLPDGVRVFAKLESQNPGGSIKDRPVARMLATALEDGSLAGGRRVLDSSSGNAGIAYAQLGAALGIGVTLVVPENASSERLDRIRAAGAELVLTPAAEGYDHAIREAGRLARERPERYWYADQYGNPANWRSHYDGTGEEILRGVEAASGGPPDAFVAGVGTGGTVTGVARRLREAGPGLRVRVVVPERFPGIEGLKPLGAPEDIVPAILDESLIDERVDASSESALDRCHALARAGLFVGPSSGAFVDAAFELACSGSFERIATVLPDTGERYASTGMWATEAGAARALG